MKKTLIALAALAATAAFAQSSVSITGGMRLGYGQLADGSKGLMTTQGSGNTINVTVVEDLGGGLAAEGAVQYRYDMANGKNNASAAAADGRLFQTTRVGLKGAFGAVQMGRIGLDQHWGYTAFGSTSAGAAVMPVGDFGATENAQMRYISPNISGFQAHLALSNKGAAFNTGAQDGTQLLLSYANGPVTLMYVNEQIGTPGTGASAAVVSGSRGSQFGGSYDMGVAKLNVISGSLDNASGAELKSAFTVSGTVPMGALTLKGALKNNRVANGADVTAVGVDYAFSKRTVAEVTSWKASNAKSNFWVGLKHSF